MDFLNEKLQERISTNSLRTLQATKGMVDFCSNDYLGIARNDLIKISGNYKHGSSGSRLLAGNSPFVEEIERAIATFHQGEAALVFNSGYDANLGLLSCIGSKESTIIYDQLCHASIRDGIRLSRAQSFSFLHNDTADLEKKLKISKGNSFIVTESVFSMDGHLAPLEAISNLAEKYNAELIVDEAHAIGIIGEKGEGLAQCKNIHQKCFARIYTFGKACGVHGAAIVGSESLRNYLINFARSFIYTTALPEASIAAIEASYNIFPTLIKERLYLQELIYRMQHSDLNIIKSQSPIQAIIVPGNIVVKNLAKKLQQNNMDARAILYPTVPEGLERIRVIVHSYNTIEQVEKLIYILKE